MEKLFIFHAVGTKEHPECLSDKLHPSNIIHMYISVSFFHRGELFIVRNCEQIRDFYFISIVKSMEVGEEIQNDRRRNIDWKNV